MTFVRVFVLGVLTIGFSAFATAQATRTWVSGIGDDANPCSRTAPWAERAGLFYRPSKSMDRFSSGRSSVENQVCLY
jgi:hypothetical protein